MSDAQQHFEGAVLTVLGPIAPEDLGIVAIHEALLSVVPGAQFAFDITINRAEIFDILAHKLQAFKLAGGSTVVDSTGMFHGRDLRMYEALSRETGVHIIASTGMGPEEQLGGYFLTPQTNPPTPWPAEKFSDLFVQEVTEGMVLPRLERRAPAGFITTAADSQGMTATEVSLLRGSARAAVQTGLSVSLRFGADALTELAEIYDEGLPPERVLVGGLDRKDGLSAARAVAEAGSFVGIDHVGQQSNSFLTDGQRVDLITDLISNGHANRIIISSNSVGVAKGHDAPDVELSSVITDFLPQLHTAGVSEEHINQILVHNPRALLTVHSPIARKS